MSDIECPYCETNCGVPEENTGEGDLVEWECDNCQKKFMYYCQYSVDYYSKKVPCLNGGKHKWRAIVGVPVEFFEGKFRCEWCNEEKKKEVVNSSQP